MIYGQYVMCKFIDVYDSLMVGSSKIELEQVMFKIMPESPAEIGFVVTVDYQTPNTNWWIVQPYAKLKSAIYTELKDATGCFARWALELMRENDEGKVINKPNIAKEFNIGEIYARIYEHTVRIVRTDSQPIEFYTFSIYHDGTVLSSNNRYPDVESAEKACLNLIKAIKEEKHV